MRRTLLRLLGCCVIFVAATVHCYTGAPAGRANGQGAVTKANDDAPLLVVQTGHVSFVSSVAYSPNGLVLASGSADSTVKLWEVDTGRELRSLAAQEGHVGHVTFNHDGSLLATVSSQRLYVSGNTTKIGNTITLWDVETGAGRAITVEGSFVTHLAFSPDGRTLAAGGEDRKIRLFDVGSGAQLFELPGHGSYINSLKFRRQGSELASASDDGTVKLWDLKSGRELPVKLTLPAAKGSRIEFDPDAQIFARDVDNRIELWNVTTGQKIRTFAGHTKSITRIAFSPDGRMLASAGDGAIKLWDVEGGKVIRTLTGPEHSVWSLAFDREGKRLAAGYFEKFIKLWDVEKGEEIRTFSGNVKRQQVVAYSTDGRTLATGDDGGAIRLWDAVAGSGVREMKGHAIMVHRLVFNPVDHRMLASASPDGMIKLWDVRGGTETHTLSEAHLNHERFIDPHLKFSPDGRVLAGAVGDNTIRLWDAKSGREIHTLRTHTLPITSLAYSPDGRVLASGSQDKTIRLWDVATGKELKTLIGHNSPIFVAGFGPDGRVLGSISDDATEKQWDVATGKELRTSTLMDLSYRDADYLTMTISYDRRFLAARAGHDAISLYDVASGRRTRSVAGTSELVGGIALSDDARLLASAGADDIIRLWEVSTGREMRALAGGAKGVLDTRFSPDGHVLAASTKDRNITLWDVSSGKVLHTLGGHTGNIKFIRFSRDGRLLASWGDDDTIRMWDVATGASTHTLTAEYNGAPFSGRSDFRFSPDGRLLASTGMNHTIKLWNLETGKLAHTLPADTARVSAFFAFSPDGRWLVSGGEDKTVKLWDAKGGKLLRVFAGHGGPVYSVAFSDDGRLLASGGADKTVKLWDLATGKEVSTLTGVAAGGVYSISFNSDGSRVDSYDGGHTIKVWDVPSGKEVSNLVVDELSNRPSVDELRTMGNVMDAAQFARGLSPDKQLQARMAADRTELYDHRTGKLLCSLIAFGNNDWAVVAPDGLFDGTAEAVRQVSWRIGNSTFSVLPLDAFYNDYYHPGLLTDIIAGERPRSQVDIATVLQLPGLRTMLRQGSAKIERRDGEVVLCFSEKPTSGTTVYTDGHPLVIPRRETYHENDPSCRYRVPLPANKQYEVIGTIGGAKLNPFKTPYDGVRSETSRSILHVLTVGVGNYDFQSSGLRALPASTAGAKQVEKFFAGQNRRAGKPFKEIRVWDGLYDEAATRNAIRRRLAELTEAAGEDDVVFLFFSGHGAVPAGKEMFYFAPVDARPGPQGLQETGINTAMLAGAVRQMRARRVVLIIDACQSGGIIEPLAKVGEVKAKIEELRARAGGRDEAADRERGVGVYVVAAATPLQQAVQSRAGNSALVTTLLESLGVEGRGGGGKVWMSDVIGRIQRRLPEVSARAGQRHTPMSATVGLDYAIAGSESGAQNKKAADVPRRATRRRN